MPRSNRRKKDPQTPTSGWAKVFESYVKEHKKLPFDDMLNLISCMHPYHDVGIVCFTDHTSITVDQDSYQSIIAYVQAKDPDRMVYFEQTKEWFILFYTRTDADFGQKRSSIASVNTD